ncbi:MAG: mannitol dehydrogenase family protein, partial [Clostridia bacterium]|nr:mannitol dehydrogenase family protein [Clostridia bacterium]
VDDEGNAFELSSDPLLDTLRPMVADIHLGDSFTPAALKEKLNALLSNAAIFGVDLIEAGLADAVCENLSKLISGKGAVRQALKAL